MLKLQLILTNILKIGSDSHDDQTHNAIEEKNDSGIDASEQTNDGASSEETSITLPIPAKKGIMNVVLI